MLGTSSPYSSFILFEDELDYFNLPLFTFWLSFESEDEDDYEEELDDSDEDESESEEDEDEEY